MYSTTFSRLFVYLSVFLLLSSSVSAKPTRFSKDSDASPLAKRADKHQPNRVDVNHVSETSHNAASANIVHSKNVIVSASNSKNGASVAARPQRAAVNVAHSNAAKNTVAEVSSPKKVVTNFAQSNPPVVDTAHPKKAVVKVVQQKNAAALKTAAVTVAHPKGTIVKVVQPKAATNANPSKNSIANTVRPHNVVVPVVHSKVVDPKNTAAKAAAPKNVAGHINVNQPKKAVTKAKNFVAAKPQNVVVPVVHPKNVVNNANAIHSKDAVKVADPKTASATPKNVVAGRPKITTNANTASPKSNTANTTPKSAAATRPNVRLTTPNTAVNTKQPNTIPVTLNSAANANTASSRNNAANTTPKSVAPAPPNVRLTTSNTAVNTNQPNTIPIVNSAANADAASPRNNAANTTPKRVANIAVPPNVGPTTSNAAVNANQPNINPIALNSAGLPLVDVASLLGLGNGIGLSGLTGNPAANVPGINLNNALSSPPLLNGDISSTPPSSNDLLTELGVNSQPLTAVTPSGSFVKNAANRLLSTSLTGSGQPTSLVFGPAGTSATNPTASINGGTNSQLSNLLLSLASGSSPLNAAQILNNGGAISTASTTGSKSQTLQVGTPLVDFAGFNPTDVTPGTIVGSANSGTAPTSFRSVAPITNAITPTVANIAGITQTSSSGDPVLLTPNTANNALVLSGSASNTGSPVINIVPDNTTPSTLLASLGSGQTSPSSGVAGVPLVAGNLVNPLFAAAAGPSSSSGNSLAGTVTLSH